MRLAEPSDPLVRYVEECRGQVFEEILEIAPRLAARLDEPLRRDPLRSGGALRPALCVATCRALGGHFEAVLRTAAALELCHERGAGSLLADSLEPLLDNIELLGLGRALRILRLLARMARESAEGRRTELEWVRGSHWTPSDRDYFRVVYKRAVWSDFLAPALAGAIAAGAQADVLRGLARFLTPLGVAFAIQNDVARLAGDESRCGAEVGADAWSGTHTLVWIHALRRATAAERAGAVAMLTKSHVATTSPALRDLVARTGAADSALSAAHSRARRARRSFEKVAGVLAPSEHRGFLAALVDLVAEPA